MEPSSSSSSSSVITPEDVLESLMNDGTIDALRLKIINQLKANEELKNTAIRMAEESKVLNTPGAEKQTKRELFDSLRQELETPVLEKASRAVWELILDSNGLGREISETVERVFCRLSGQEPPLFPLPNAETQPHRENENKVEEKEESASKKEKLNSKEARASRKEKSNSKEEGTSRKEKSNSKEEGTTKKEKSNSKEEGTSKKEKSNSKDEGMSKKEKSNSKSKKRSHREMNVEGGGSDGASRIANDAPRQSSDPLSLKERPSKSPPSTVKT